jgi:hypothetical protein
MKVTQMHVRQSGTIDPDEWSKPADGVWRPETPFFPRWVAGRFRRHGLECRRYLVGGMECDLRTEWQLAEAKE